MSEYVVPSVQIQKSSFFSLIQRALLERFTSMCVQPMAQYAPNEHLKGRV